MNISDIVWVDPTGPLPKRSVEGDAQSWSVWVDMTGDAAWAAHSGNFPAAVLTTGLSKTAAYGMAWRLHVVGLDRPVGVHREA